MIRLLEEDKVLFGEDENKIIELKIYAQDYQDKLSSVIEADGRVGAYDLRELFVDVVKIFNNPKPVSFLSGIFSYVLKAGDTVLDFFSGSGSTAHSVMKLNLEDGGNRQFICVQLPELLDDKNEAYKAGYRALFHLRVGECFHAAK